MATKQTWLTPRLSLLLFIFVITTPTTSTVAEPIRVETKRIHLNSGNPLTKNFGKFIYRGGFEMQSDAAQFGGFSSLGISSDGNRLVTISDIGKRLAAKLRYDRTGYLIGLESAELDSLSDRNGKPLSTKEYSDAEAMSPGVKGEIIVAFERNHRLWRYLPNETIPLPLVAPLELAKLPINSGIEALTLLDDGSLLAISEGSNDTNHAIAWVSDPAGWSVMTYRTNEGFRASGAATLPDGNVLVLERRYTLRAGVAIRILRIDSRTIKPGAHLEGQPLAEFRQPLNVDNFEGIEVRRDEKGQSLVYIISDNNFNPLQRTLLMMFVLMK